MINLGSCKQKDRQVGQEEHIACVVPAVSEQCFIDESFYFGVVVHAVFDLLCSFVELSHQLKEQVNDEYYEA